MVPLPSCPGRENEEDESGMIEAAGNIVAQLNAAASASRACIICGSVFACTSQASRTLTCSADCSLQKRRKRKREWMRAQIEAKRGTPVVPRRRTSFAFPDARRRKPPAPAEYPTKSEMRRELAIAAANTAAMAGTSE
jgi:hypothetical protein